MKKSLLSLFLLVVGTTLTFLACSIDVDDDTERYTNNLCIFRNNTDDTLYVVVSFEYPDTLHPQHPNGKYYALPHDDILVKVDYSDIFAYFDIVQLFVYPITVPEKDEFLREMHAELVRYELTEQSLIDRQWVVTYSR